MDTLYTSRIIAVFSVLTLFTLPVGAASTNLVYNGDFELGNTGFSSNYAYSSAPTTAEAVYTITTNPLSWHLAFVPIGDHTSGTGNMFVANGDPTPGNIVWQSQLITVLPNTTYFFETWATNVCCTPGFSGGDVPAILEFSVVGATVDTLGATPIGYPAGTWQFFGRTWNSGANTSVTLNILDQNTVPIGNDFSIDDIHFGTASSAVPLPPAIWLAGSGLLVLFGRMKRRPNIDS